MSPLEIAAILGAGLAAGTINTIVGSGSLITFPTLLAFGYSPIVANVSNTVGLVPGSVSGAFGYKRELAGQGQRALWLGVSSAAGGLTGAVLLLAFPGAFAAIVPVLIAIALVLVAIGPRLSKALAEHRHADSHRSLALGALFYATAIYGGYFGAGISIIMLSALGILGMTDILEMNALTSLLSLCINGVAIVFFVLAHLVYWPFVLAMACGALLGGYGAAGVARRVGRTAVRRFVIAVGFTLAAVFFFRTWR